MSAQQEHVQNQDLPVKTLWAPIGASALLAMSLAAFLILVKVSCLQNLEDCVTKKKNVELKALGHTGVPLNIVKHSMIASLYLQI